MSEHRLQKSEQLVVASHNQGKIREIAELTKPYGLNVISAGELNLPEPEETGTTFNANALLKALAAAEASGKPSLADDSGIEVAGLDGAPGIYSARWAGPGRDFSVAMERVWNELQQKKDTIEWPPKANFTCSLCLAWPDGTHKFFDGKIFGTLVWPVRGELGFGYDPMFVPDGYNQTFGEIESDIKQKISHRARAFQLFVRECLEPAE